MTETQVKAAVRKRDGYKCVCCGMPNAIHIGKYKRQLEVHRVVPGSKYTVDGCCTLCDSCHAPQPRLPHGSKPFQKVEVPKHLYYLIRCIAQHRGLKIGQYVEQLLGKIVQAQFNELRCLLDNTSSDYQI